MKSFVTIDLAAYEFQPMLGKPFGCISVSDLQCQESHLSVDYFPIHRKEKQKKTIVISSFIRSRMLQI